MAGTTISYNGVTIQDVLIENISQKKEFSPGGYDRYVKTTITCTGTLFYTDNNITGGFGLRLPGSLPAGLRSTCDTLSEAQKNFTLSIDGVTAWNVRGVKAQSSTNANLDIDNGPKTSAKVLHVFGSHSARILFTIELSYVPCSNNSVKEGSVIWLDFWQSVTVDDRWMETRVYEGILRTATRINSVHQFQGIVRPPLSRGFKVERMEFSESQDGLSLRFRITQKQLVQVPPFPAVKWRGTHAIEYPKPGLNTPQANISVEVNGTADTDKEALWYLCYQIMNRKLHLEEVINEQIALVTQLSFEEGINDTTILGRATVRQFGMEKDDRLQFQSRDRTFAKPLTLPNFNYDPKRFLNPIPSTSLANIFTKAMYNDSCVINTQNFWQQGDDPDTNYTKEKATNDKSEQPEYTQVVNSPGNNQELREVQTSYSHYYVTSHYQFRSGVVNLPLAVPAAGVATEKSKQFTMHQPFGKRRINIDAERVNDYPDIPAFVSFKDKNGTTLTPHVYEPQLNNPQLSSDGRKVLYSAKFTADYWMSETPEPGKGLPTGTTPFVLDRGAVISELGPQRLQSPNSSNYKAIR